MYIFLNAFDAWRKGFIVSILLFGETESGVVLALVRHSLELRLKAQHRS